MKKLFKKQMVFLGIAITSVALGVCMNNTKQNTYNASAETTVTSLADVDSFVMEKGASVKVATKPEDAGLSFSATLDNAQYNDLLALGTVKVGFAIAPKNYADINALSKENLFGTGAKYYFEDNKIEGELNDKNQLEIFHIDTPRVKVEGSTRTYIGSIVNFGSLTEDLLREYVCASYIEVIPTGTSTPQYLMAQDFENDVKNSTRSMVYVAQHALATNDANVTDKEAFKNAYLTKDVLSKDVTYTTNVYINDMLIESKTDNVAKLNDTVSYENSTYANFDGYRKAESIAYADGSTVLDIRLTPQMETKDTVYLSAWTAYTFNNPTHLFPLTEGGKKILADDGLSIKKQTAGAAGYGMTNDSSLTGNRQLLVKDYGLLGKELEYLALYANGTAAKYTVMPVTQAIATRADLEGVFNDTVSIKAGYYVLTDDIDMSASIWSYNASRYMGPESSKVMSTYTGNIHGFHGIFDGLGHTIKNLTTEKTFFGSIHPGSIIRNIGFTNVKETTVRGFLAGVCGGELNNVYVSYAENQVKSLALTQDSYNGFVLNNVVVDYTNALTPTGTGSALSYYGVMEPFGNNKNKLDVNHNFFVISDMPLMMKLDNNTSDATGAKWNTIIDGYNQKKKAQDYMDALGSTFPSGLTDTKISHLNKSVLRFDKVGDMKDYLKEDQAKGENKTLDLSGFNAKFWTFNAETGELTWNIANN